MTERPTLAVGLMSGTSLDGMDAALVRFAGPTRATLVAFATRGYAADERARIRAVIDGADARAAALLHADLALWAGDAVQAVLDAGHVKALELAVIGFHGQTVWHEPPAVSWQIGEPAVLAEQFGVPVVSDFRSRDVAAGGQGAPLVPMADVLLFGGDAPRILLNVGGMANFTFVSHRACEEDVIALDTGPGMAVIDMVARLVNPAVTCDLDGSVSRGGAPDEAVLAELLADEYFSAPPPKSTGRERFGDAYARSLHARVPGASGVATAIELTARSIAAAVGRWGRGAADVVISGGGAHHPGLMASLARHLGSGTTLRRFDELFFNGDAKEAVAFALLAYLTLHGQPGNLPGATGATRSRVLGSITPA